MDLLPKSQYKELKSNIDARFEALTDLTQNCKTAIQSHTGHITKLKKDIENKAQKRQIDEVSKQLKRFALNDDYK